MGKILDEAIIKIDYVWRDKTLAKVTLNFADECEVRFCRITLRPNKTLWFQPPALSNFGYVKCFAVLEKSEWKKLEVRVLEKFTEGLEEQVQNGYVDPQFLNTIKESIVPEEEINIDDIPF